MAIISSFYDGPVDEIAWSKGVGDRFISRYGVEGLDDWRVTQGPGDRVARILPGVGYGKGVVDVLDTNFDLPSVPAVATGQPDRWDMIVARRTWSTNTTTFRAITGTSTKALPSRVVGNGVVDEQPLALVRVKAGQTAFAEIVDLRCWAANGGTVAADVLCLQYLNHIGSSVMVGTIRWDRVVSGNQAAWLRTATGGAIGYARTGPFVEPTVSNGLIHELTIPYPGFPYHIFTHATLEFGGGGPGTRWNIDLSINGAVVDGSRGDATAPWAQLKGNSWGGPATGQTKVRLSASRMAGSGVFGLSRWNQWLSALIVPALPPV